MIIYQAINILTNKRYIGQTRNSLEERKRQHIATSKARPQVSWHFYSAIAKYGIDAFEWSVLDVAKTQQELNEKESYWIEFFDTTNPSRGYNLKGGGSFPFLTDEIKRKIGQAQLGKLNHRYGKTGALTQNSKKVIIINTNEIFDSVLDLCRAYPQFQHSKVCCVCRGKRETHKGYKFRYLDENLNIIPTKYSVDLNLLINKSTGEAF